MFQRGIRGLLEDMCSNSIKSKVEKMEDPWEQFKNGLIMLSDSLETNANQGLSNDELFDMIWWKMEGYEELDVLLFDKIIEEFRGLSKKIFKEDYKYYFDNIKARFIEEKFKYEIRVLGKEINITLGNIYDESSALGVIVGKLDRLEINRLIDGLLDFYGSNEKCLNIVKVALIKNNEQLLNEFEYEIMNLIYKGSNWRKLHDEKLSIILNNILDSETRLGAITKKLDVTVVDSVMKEARCIIEAIFGKDYESSSKEIQKALIRVSDFQISKKNILYLSEQIGYKIEDRIEKRIDFINSEMRYITNNKLLYIILEECLDTKTILGVMINRLDLSLKEMVIDENSNLFQKYFQEDYEICIKIIKTMLKDFGAYKLNKFIYEYIVNSKATNLISKVLMCNIDSENILNMNDEDTTFIVDLKAFARKAINYNN